MIGDANRVTPSWVRDRRTGPDPALLVCAYDDDAKCRSMFIPGSITLNELIPKAGSLPKDQQLVFYCG
jgi:hypothetical protein